MGWCNLPTTTEGTGPQGEAGHGGSAIRPRPPASWVMRVQHEITAGAGQGCPEGVPDGVCQWASKMSGSGRCPAKGAERPERVGSRVGFMTGASPTQAIRRPFGLQRDGSRSRVGRAGASGSCCRAVRMSLPTDLQSNRQPWMPLGSPEIRNPLRVWLKWPTLMPNRDGVHMQTPSAKERRRIRPRVADRPRPAPNRSPCLSTGVRSLCCSR